MAFGSANAPGVSIAQLKAVESIANKALEEARKYANVILVAPSQGDSLTYTGKAQNPIWDNYDTEKLAISGTISGTDAGTYSAIFTPKEGYKWADETNDAKSVTWKIGRASVDLPTVSGSLTYTGSAQSPKWNGYDAAKLTIGGTTSSTNAGTYSATFTPASNYQWPDGSTATRSVSWNIQKAIITAVPSQNGTPAYTGSAQSPTWNNYDTAKLTIGGTTSGTNTGTYSATFTPKSNYQWPDGSTTAKTVNWTIAKASLSVPAQSGSLTYTGSTQSPTWSNYDSTKLTIGGTTSGINAGTYSATFTPKANYQWTNGSTTAKTVNWSISKAAGSLSLNKTSLSITGVSGTTGTITVTRSGDGTISATSSNTSVATVSVSGNTVTVTAKASGSATITVKVAAGTNYAAPSNKTCSVTVKVPKIYGVSWDGTSTTKWSRTDDAAGFTDPVPYVAGATKYSSLFDDLMPWKGMVKSERTGGTMVAIPKFWYKLTQNGNGMTIKIADAPVSGYSVSPAHMDRGDGKGERDVVYVGRYHCGETNYKSVTGQKPKVKITRATARTEIHKLGSNIWQADLAMRYTLSLLYLVEFANWNSQACIGYGCGNNSDVQAMGYTNSMPYHTGTTQSSRTTYGLGTQYRYIEGLWDNVVDWIDGCYNDGKGLNIILNPNNFSDSSGGTNIGKPSNGYPSVFAVTTKGSYPIFIPSAASGSENTYSCDYWDCNTSYPCVCVGGSCGRRTDFGLFFVSCSSASNETTSFGSRLMELP